jgi:hypothetical protein
MLNLAVLATSLLLQTPPAVAPRVPLSRDSLLILRTLAMERSLFTEWARAWRSSDSIRSRAFHYREVGTTACPPTCNVRNADVLCMFTWDDQGFPYPPDSAYGADVYKRSIASKKDSRHWVCPNWLPPEGFFFKSPHPPDERLGIDGALEPRFLTQVARQRQAVISQFAGAVGQLPRSTFLIGQLVRLEMDAGAYDRALQSARTCAAGPSWCLALLGYIYHRTGRIAAADDAFTKSMRAASPVERCQWSDISPLLDGDARRHYTSANCTQRDSLNDVIWWLADPLWSVDGNDRRTEQYARMVTIALHSATGRDERYTWIPEGGGDALAEMVMRYGWPSYTYGGYNGGKPAQMGLRPEPLYGYVQLYLPKPKGPALNTANFDRARDFKGMKTTYEYTVGRVRVIPAWSMVANPFAITNADWGMNAPGGMEDATVNWWPREHYAPVHPVVGISDQQTTFLRRQNETLIAYATNLGQTDLTRRMGDSVDASFMVSTGPGAIVSAAEKRVEAHDRLTFLAPLPAAFAVVSAEVRWDSAGRRGARSRFGVSPVAPLSSLVRGEFAISNPVLLVVPPDATELPNLADSAVGLMRGSTTLSVGTNAIGVYWETYGFAAEDSVEITVSVQRHSGNVLGRIAAAASVIGDPNSAVTMSWREPQPGHTARTIGGPVPIQMRSVVIGIPSLTPGDYTLEVSARKQNGAEVKGKREFVLR